MGYFSSVDKYTGNPSDCTDNIRTKIEEFLNEVRTKLNNHAVKKHYTECVVKEIKTDIYENHRLAALAADMKGIGIKFWKIGDKNKYIETNQMKAQEVEDNALIKCQGQKKYGEFFDSFYEQKKVEQYTNEFDYCMRKHLLDKNLINNNQYGYKINPKSIPTDRVRCDEIMSLAFEQMKAQINADGAQQCTVDKFITYGYLDEILKIQLLSKLTMTPDEKNMEKQKFISQMIYLTDLIKSCPM